MIDNKHMGDLQLISYEPFNNLYQGLFNWSIKVKPTLSKSQREGFVLGIINKRYHNIVVNAQEYVRGVENEKRKIKTLLYEGKQIINLANAEIGRYYLLISNKGNKHYLKCVGREEKQGYDYNEWCISERGYSYTIPIFENVCGKRCSYAGKAIVITEDEFNKQLINLQL